jgi:hypothetical protein
MTSPAPAPRPVRVFVAYAHEDVAHRDRLVKIMVPWERQGTVKVWADHKLVGGDVWDKKIKEALEEADLILILMSVDAIASEYIRGVELRRAMERHDQGTARVIPLIVRICAWKEETWLGQVQAIPRGGTPIAEHASPDRAWDEVREQLRDVIDELQKSITQPGATAKPSPKPPVAPPALIRSMPGQAKPSKMRVSRSAPPVDLFFACLGIMFFAVLMTLLWVYGDSPGKPPPWLAWFLLLGSVISLIIYAVTPSGRK